MMKIFDEEAWLCGQTSLAESLHTALTDWFSSLAIKPALRQRLAARALSGESNMRTDSPALLAMRLAGSMGAEQSEILRLGVACTLFWSAADAADDVDDGDGEKGLTANDACGLLFLAQKAFLEWRPAFAALAIEYGLKMSYGQMLDLQSTGFALEPDVDEIANHKAGAELEFFLVCAGKCGQGESPGVNVLGRSLGHALQVMSDVVDLYAKAQSSDLISGKWSAPLSRYMASQSEALAMTLTSPMPGGKANAAFWYAFPRERPEIQAQVRFEAAESASAVLGASLRPFLAAWETTRPHCRYPEHFDSVAAWLSATFATLGEALREIEPAPAPMMVTSKQAVLRATSYLEEHNDVAEEHRWGLFDKELVVGNLFPNVFRAAALRASGGNWRSVLQKILGLRDPEGWRYYPHEDAIPPDSDDSGLILGYFSEALPLSVRQAAIGQLLANYTEQSIHTWMGASAQIPWGGDDCIATLANASWGLLRVDQGKSIPQGVWYRLTQALLNHTYQSPFYGASAVRYFVGRTVATAFGAGLLDSDSHERARKAVQDELAAEERIDGSFGSILETAFTLQLAGYLALPIRRHAMRSWFAERQEADGSWRTEPVFAAPGVNYRPMVWGHAALTTSVVVLTMRLLEDEG